MTSAQIVFENVSKFYGDVLGASPSRPAVTRAK